MYIRALVILYYIVKYICYLLRVCKLVKIDRKIYT